MKVFLCFSSQDRYTVVNSVLYHLKNYGIPVWYDYHELTLGDDRIIGNFDLGLDICQYAVVIFTPNMFECKCGNDELDEIKARYKDNTIHVFPLFYNIKANELPEKYKWLSSLIYNEINDTTGTLPACNQIVYQIVNDTLNKYKKHQIKDFIHSLDTYISNSIKLYEQTDKDNFNARFTMLYMIYLYLCSNNVKIDSIYRCILNRMCKLNQLNISFPHKEMLIIEKILLILLNEYIID